MVFERRRESVEPMDTRHEIGQRSHGLSLIDAHWYYHDAFVDCVLDFAPNLRRIVRIR